MVSTAERARMRVSGLYAAPPVKKRKPRTTKRKLITMTTEHGDKIEVSIGAKVTKAPKPEQPPMSPFGVPWGGGLGGALLPRSQQGAAPKRVRKRRKRR